MRVGSFFFLCMMLGAFAGIGYAAFAVAEAWGSYADARTARLELIAFRDVFKVPETVAAERLASVGQATAPTAAGEAEGRAMAALRQSTDAAFEAATQALRATPDALQREQEVQASRARIAAVRQDVDRLAALPRTTRPAAADLGSTLQPIQLVFGDINTLLTLIQSRPVLADSVIQDYLDAARLAYSLRIWMAQRGTALIGAIASGRPMEPALLEDLANAAGHLEEVWDQVKTLQGTRQLAPDVLAAIEAVQSRYFGDNGRLYARVVAAGRGQGAYPPLADFRRDHLAGVMSPFLVRDSAIGQAIARDEALYQAALVRLQTALGLLVGVCVIVAGATWLFTRRVVGALTALTAAITALAARDHSIKVPHRDRRDEVGRMAAAIEILRANEMASAALGEQVAREQGVRQQRAERIGLLCEAFHADTGTTIEAALASAAEMRQGVTASQGLVAEVERRAVTVGAATAQASSDVQAIVGSAEHLTQSIRELAAQVHRSVGIAVEAEGSIGHASERMRELTAATGKIGAVTSLIQEIANQTNLLALNATIEAARAGDAGKGFAVVASEVKALAKQTARATDDIAGQIALLQEATVGVSATITDIVRTITDVSRLGRHVADAVEQQQQATDQIGSCVLQASGGMQAVADNIAGVQGVASRTGAAAGEMAQSVARLTEDAERLTGQIASFVANVRAA